tara:strand:- start:4130 stop:4453 length:324 start_codon:yes stop_codon:yes gene_type:complete
MQEKFADASALMLIAGLWLLGIMAGLARRALLVQEGKLPSFFDKSMWLDFPATCICVVVGLAINEQLGLSGWTAAAVVALSCYLGVRTVLVLLARWRGVQMSKDDLS